MCDAWSRMRSSRAGKLMSQAVSDSEDGTGGKDNGSVVCLEGMEVTGIRICHNFQKCTCTDALD